MSLRFVLLRSLRCLVENQLRSDPGKLQSSQIPALMKGNGYVWLVSKLRCAKIIILVSCLCHACSPGMLQHIHRYNNCCRYWYLDESIPPPAPNNSLKETCPPISRVCGQKYKSLMLSRHKNSTTNKANLFSKPNCSSTHSRDNSYIHIHLLGKHEKLCFHTNQLPWDGH